MLTSSEYHICNAYSVDFMIILKNILIVHLFCRRGASVYYIVDTKDMSSFLFCSFKFILKTFTYYIILVILFRLIVCNVALFVRGFDDYSIPIRRPKPQHLIAGQTNKRLAWKTADQWWHLIRCDVVTVRYAGAPSAPTCFAARSDESVRALRDAASKYEGYVWFWIGLYVATCAWNLYKGVI